MAKNKLGVFSFEGILYNALQDQKENVSKKERKNEKKCWALKIIKLREKHVAKEIL